MGLKSRHSGQVDVPRSKFREKTALYSRSARLDPIIHGILSLVIGLGGRRVLETGAERGARQDPTCQVRALGGDRRQGQQSPYRRNRDGPGYGRTV